MTNPSNIFKSSSELANSVYKQTRNRYSQFKIGILSCLVMIAGIIYDAYNQYLWIEFGCDTINIAIHVAVFLIFVTVIVLSVFFMLSGGKKDLLGKEKESVFIYEDHLMIFYYLPKGKYKAIKNNIYFCDIRSMEYDGRKKRLAIKSDCQIQKSKDLASINSIEDAELDDKENCTTYIYAKYKDFETIMKKVETLSLKKISSDSALYAE